MHHLMFLIVKANFCITAIVIRFNILSDFFQPLLLVSAVLSQNLFDLVVWAEGVNEVNFDLATTMLKIEAG